MVFVNPPVVNAELGIRRSYLSETRRVATEFLKRQLQVIVFAQSRLATEILTTYLKDAFSSAPGAPEAIRGYRGGYLPNRRRSVERELRAGAALGVAASFRDGGLGPGDVIAIADDGQFLNAPDTYMQKIAVGPEARGVIDLRESPTWNLQRIAKAKGKKVEDCTCVILDRDRHKELIGEVRQMGARIRLIGDGDVSGVIATSQPDSGVDIYIGSGGAPEGVLAAAALRCVGGFMQGRLILDSPEKRQRAGRCSAE